MALAVLSIDLEARLAKFEADMGKATRLLQSLGEEARSAVGGIGAVFAGSFLSSAAEEGLKRLVDLFPHLIEGVAKFQDLSEETGASAAGLARMQTAADVSGVSVETLAGLMVKLTGNLSKLTEDSKGAGQALANLGIPLEEFRKLAPDEQVVRLSAAFNSFADGSAKTSNALALFGKSGAQVLKFFKEFGDGSEAAVRLTDDQIKAADDFADAAAKQSSQFRQTASVIAVQFLPAMTALKGAAGDVVNEFIKARSGAKDLSDDKSLREWGFEVAIAMGEAVDSIDFIVRRAVIGAKTLGAAGLAIKEAFTPNLLRNSDVSRAEALNDLWKAYAADVQSTLAGQLGMADKIKARADLARATLLVAGNANDTGGGADVKPVLKPVTVPDKADTRAADALARMLADIEKRKTAAQAEIEQGGKLADSDKFRLDILAKLGEEEGKLAKGAPAKIRAALDEAVAVLKLNEAREQDVKNKEAQGRLDERALAATNARVDALTGENTALRLNIEELGLSADAVDKLRVKRLQASLVSLAVDEGANRFEIEQLQKKIDLTQQLIDKRNFAATDGLKGANTSVAEFLDKVGKTGEATRDATRQSIQLLEDDLTSSLASGQISVKRTVDFMINEFLRLTVVRPLLKNLFGDGSSAAGLFAKFFGGGFGSGTSSAAGGDYGFNALGNAFGASGVIPHAMGDVIDRPRFFAAGGMLNVAGEAGPEGILPLKRGRDGRLGVTVNGAGGGGPVLNLTQHFSINGDVTPTTIALVQSMIDRSNALLMRNMRTGVGAAG